MTKMDERIRDRRLRSAGWTLGLAAGCLVLLMALPAASRAQGSVSSGLRLPDDFQPPARTCLLESNCKVELRAEGRGLIWFKQCGQAPDADAAQRLMTLRQRQKDVLVIVVAPSKKAWLPKILDYLDEQRMSLLLDEGRIRVVRIDGKRAAENLKKLEEFCAQPISADGLAMVPNTGFVFVGDKSEAPTKNPCRDDRWNDGVPLMSKLDDMFDLIGEKASSIVLSQRQLRDMESHQRRFCEESGTASEFVEVVVPDPATVPRGARALGERDLGLSDANVRTQLERLGIRVEARNLKMLKPGDLRGKAKRASDGTWSISLASLQDLIRTAEHRAANYNPADERKALLSRVQVLERTLNGLNREFAGAGPGGQELTAQGIQGRMVALREKHGRMCGSNSDLLDCDTISRTLVEVKLGLGDLDQVQRQPGLPFQPRTLPRAGQGGMAAQDAQDWVERTLRRVEDLRAQAAGCKDSECIEAVEEGVAGVERTVRDREPAIREAARAGAGDSESGRLLRLNSMLVRAEQALADLGGTSGKWSTMKIAGVATLVGGGLLALGGIVPLVLANQDRTWLRDTKAQGVPAGCVADRGSYVKASCPLMAEVDDRIGRQELRAIVGYAVMGAGIAAIIAGTTVLVVDHNKSAGGRPQVSVSPTHQGAVVGISATF